MIAHDGFHIITACTVGMYKPDVSNTSCRPCPVNSTAENRASDFCECIRGTIRDPERPNDVCQDFATFLSSKFKNIFAYSHVAT